jgi:hypothetical protein
MALQFLVQGYSAGNYNEILWPLAMTTLLLRSIRDQYYAASCIALDLKYEYRTAPSNVSLFFFCHGSPTDLFFVLRFTLRI